MCSYTRSPLLESHVADGLRLSLWCVFPWDFRILDIEWALEHSKSHPALQSPKRGKKKKRTKKTKPIREEEEEVEQMDVDEVADALGELTNIETGSSSFKRTREEAMDYDVGTPAKRLCKAKKAVALDSDDEEYVAAAPIKDVIDIPSQV